jgi:hypothetical protein
MWLVCSKIFISGCGEKFSARCVTKRLALSVFDIVKILSGFRRGGKLFFSLSKFFVAYHEDLFEFVSDFI